ncbi:MAG: hypothetical protein J2P58_03340 [Acidimicrobiaceae bacterium]|nr:hypothetical protein [Acidimicrobiaceae bacterium]
MAVPEVAESATATRPSSASGVAFNPSPVEAMPAGRDDQELPVDHIERAHNR